MLVQTVDGHFVLLPFASLALADEIDNVTHKQLVVASHTHSHVKS